MITISGRSKLHTAHALLGSGLHSAWRGAYSAVREPGSDPHTNKASQGRARLRAEHGRMADKRYMLELEMFRVGIGETLLLRVAKQQSWCPIGQ